MIVDDFEIVTSGVAALVGPPNAGKSTLLNSLLGQKISIVTPKPQTTRNRIAGVLNDKDYQIILLDTPGLHKSRTPLNREMVKIALDSLSEVDCVVFMIDISLPLPETVEQKKRQEYKNYFKEVQSPAILVLNKIDLVDRENLLPIIESYSDLYPFRAIIPLSALKGDGSDVLITELLNLMPKGPRFFSRGRPDGCQRAISLFRNNTGKNIFDDRAGNSLWICGHNRFLQRR